jgi:hypothetical protein
MADVAALQAAVDHADAEARRHKHQARAHRKAAQHAAAQREKLKSELSKLGIGLVSAG